MMPFAGSITAARAGKPSSGWLQQRTPPAIADRRGIWKIVVHVAVEQFQPVPGKRQSDRIILLRLLGEIGYHDDIAAFAFDPSVQDDHPVVIPGA